MTGASGDGVDARGLARPTPAAAFGLRRARTGTLGPRPTDPAGAAIRRQRRRRLGPPAASGSPRR
eukprot:9071538-Pyramimonas_sp.AAC.1